MSVRKRRWFTNKQIQRWASRLAVAAGELPDTWKKYEEQARAESAELLRNASKDPPDAVAKALAALGPKDTPKEAWIVTYADQAGTRQHATFKRKKDADDYHATVRVDINKGTHDAPNKSLTVREAAEVWIKRVEADGRERTTVRQYEQHIKHHILPRIGATKIAKLNVEAFRDSLLDPESGIRRPTARKVLTSLKSILKAVKRAHIADGISIERDKQSERDIEAGVDMPTTGEVKRLVNAAKPGRQRALLLVAATCGLRASELRGLRWSDVDLKAETIHVRQRADRYGKIGVPKTKTSVRKIPIVPEALTEIRAWRMACPKGDANPYDLVFPTSTGAIEHHANMLRSLAPVMVAARVVDKAGCPKYALHAFRHFFASWCLNPVSSGGRGMQAFQVQRLLGHSSIVMTNDVYGHLFPDQSDRAELAAASAALFA